MVEGTLTDSDYINYLKQKLQVQTDRALFFEQQYKAVCMSNEEVRRSGRYPLVIELCEMLRNKGFWAPTVTPDKDNYSEIINAFGLAFCKIEIDFNIRLDKKKK